MTKLDVFVVSFYITAIFLFPASRSRRHRNAEEEQRRCAEENRRLRTTER